MNRLSPSLLKNAFARLPAWLQRGVKAGVDEFALRSRFHAACGQLVRSARDLSDRCLSGVATREDWLQQRPPSLRQLQSMLGLDPMPARTPLNARITGVREHPAFRMEKLVFESRPGLFVTANFYLPLHRTEPAPCVVYLNGHWPSLDGAKTGFQDRYLGYPENGFALLVLDPLGFGEIPGVHPGTNRLNQWHWLSLGYTPAGVEVWNAMRALDWLATRSEVDSARIGVTGISGGGVMTQFLAALDERVAVAAPSCSTYTMGTQAAMNLVPQQCDCTFYPNVFQMDFPEVLALIAPRPLLILGGRKDPLFPPAGFRAAFRRAHRIYDLFNDPGCPAPRIRLVESNQGHTDPPHFLEETRQWMCRWLRPQAGDVPAPAGATPERPEDLRCTADLPRSALNYHVQDVWIQRPVLNTPKSSAEGLARREAILRGLRATSFAWFPQGEIPFRTRKRTASGGHAGVFADFQEYEFDSEPGVPVKAGLLTPRGRKGPLPLLVWIKGPGDSVVFPDVDEVFPVLRTHGLAILTPRFAERPLSGPEHARIERTAALAGRSIASQWVWDVLRTVDWAVRDRGLEPSGIAVHGRGPAGIAGLYAALFDSAIGQVILRDPPESHFDGPALPMVLRATDIDEVAGVLAPRRLTLLSRREGGFPLAHAIFRRMGCPASIQRAASLAEALLDPGGSEESPC